MNRRPDRCETLREVACPPRRAPRERPRTEPPPAGPEPETSRWEPREPARETLCRLPFESLGRAGRGASAWGRHRLAADSVVALRIAGIFRTVDRADLEDAFASRARARRALRELEAAGLARTERFRRGSRAIAAISLTRRGSRLLERCIDPRATDDDRAQRYRPGPARPSQVLHDTAVYRAARREIRALEAQGGRVLRIVSEDDLRGAAARRLDQARRAGTDPDAARARAGAALNLAVHDGSLAFPDARIEYERPTEGGAHPEPHVLDLEIATEHYRDAALARKAAAGFRVYALDADGGLRAVGAAPSQERAA